MVVDLFLVYQFIRRLVTPFTEWPAYKLGIIDDKGNILIKRKNFTKNAQKDAFGVFDQMILNLKKLLAKLPGGSTRLASYAAALWLIREWKHFTNESLLTEEVTDEQLEKSIREFNDRWVNYIINDEDVNSLFEKKQLEEVPANSVGGGAIAGLGVGAQGEPGLTKAQQKRYKKKNFKQFTAMLKRG